MIPIVYDDDPDATWEDGAREAPVETLAKLAGPVNYCPNASCGKRFVAVIMLSEGEHTVACPHCGHNIVIRAAAHTQVMWTMTLVSDPIIVGDTGANTALS